MRRRAGWIVLGVVVALGVAGSSVALGAPASKTSKTSKSSTKFTVVRSAGAETAGCLASAKATATIVSSGSTETLTISAQGLPHHAAFDVFATQVPSSPFGVSSFVGAFTTGNQGKATSVLVGRFSLATFTVAPAVAPAPPVDPRDAASNPSFAPVHQLHLGIWFDSPADAVAAGCANVITPFNGTHSAGPQALSTRNFADGAGPLGRIHP